MVATVARMTASERDPQNVLRSKNFGGGEAGRTRTNEPTRQNPPKEETDEVQTNEISQQDSSKAKATLLWIDLEMTGLDPEKDKICEVAAIATDIDLNEIASYEAVVRVDDKLMKERMIGPFWEKHHASRDALQAQNTSGKPVAEVERELLDFLKQHFDSKQSIYLAGNSIHQDRKFIEREMPELNKCLHYRMLDVSAWKIYFETAKGKKFAKPENHRALDDIKGSIEEFKWYLTFLR